MSVSHWRPDASTTECELCLKPFSFRVRRHHCRDCGGVFCSDCVPNKIKMPHRGFANKGQRVCKRCIRYIQAKIVGKDVEPSGLDDHSFANFGSHRVEPDEQMALMARCGRVMRQAEKAFSATNSFYKEDHEPSNENKEEGGASGDEGSPVANFSLGRAPNSIQYTRKKPILTPAVFKELTHAFPTPSQNSDPLALLNEAAAMPSVSFLRIKKSFTDLHRISVETEPQEMPAILAAPAYY